MSLVPSIEERVADVRQRIRAAARRVGRDHAGITLVAATKTVSAEKIADACAAGIETCGENRVQEAAVKIPLVPGVAWHMIGHLQRNKSRRAAELFDLIHSLDSTKLGEVLAKLGRERGRAVRVLVEINVGGEASKAGVSPHDAPALIERLSGLAGLSVEGLMTIPPPAADPESSRSDFRTVRRLAETIAERKLPGVSMTRLSMGMSADFEVAIEEGATLVRVGTGIFGPRQ